MAHEPLRPGSWRWFNTPVSIGERVAWLYARGLSLQRCVAACPEASVDSVRHAWNRAYERRFDGKAVR